MTHADIQTATLPRRLRLEHQERIRLGHGPGNHIGHPACGIRDEVSLLQDHHVQVRITPLCLTRRTHTRGIAAHDHQPLRVFVRHRSSLDRGLRPPLPPISHRRLPARPETPSARCHETHQPERGPSRLATTSTSTTRAHNRQENLAPKCEWSKPCPPALNRRIVGSWSKQQGGKEARSAHV